MRRIFQLVLSFLFLFQIQSVIASDDIYSFYYNGDSDFILRFNASLKAYARNRGTEIEFFDAKNSSSMQLNQIYSSISSKDSLIINLVDPKMASEIIYHAKSYGNRIVFFNRRPSDEVLKKYGSAWYVGTNSSAAGRYQFELIHDYLNEIKGVDRNKDGVLNIVILQGEIDHTDTKGRTEQIKKMLDESKIKYSIVSENYDNWEASAAFEDVKAQVSKVGIKNIDMIIANNDSMAVGAVDYLNTIGYNLGREYKDKSKYIPVFGVDGIPKATEYINQDKMTGTVFADFTALAKVCVDISLDDSTDDAELTRKLWYKVTDRNVSIPFVKYASFKKYAKRSR
ncbi:galactose ABC transporter substrate-binding protein [Succinivibrio dextrinosolvens]|uniref:D-galactose/methyl-galactoside binding periplasmic protein MglB n=1 Tax=Succinivibrio dextrinosolvens TaxID=83771 RepID=A0A662ZFG0_9GAMM|nr:galactose ABC transporter substrate-binding protein [Succinivibrio dextrinosolvens]SFK38777.1 methyl-galactoside transport system substrate-binding protein [Succinivibrio dextrinosolvens]